MWYQCSVPRTPSTACTASARNHVIKSPNTDFVNRPFDACRKTRHQSTACNLHLRTCALCRIVQQCTGLLQSARLTRNISWNIVPLSASSTRTPLPALPALLTALMHRKALRKTLPLWQPLLRSQRKAMLQHTAVARLSNAATLDDPWSLRLGGFVTAQDFLDKVSEKENGAAAKRAPKWRARRMGEPLREIDRPAAKRAAKVGPRPALKPRTVQRRRVDDPAQEAAPTLDEAQSSSDEGDSAGDAFDLYVSYQSSC